MEMEENEKIWKSIPFKKMKSIEIKYNMEDEKGRFEKNLLNFFKRGFIAKENIKPGLKNLN
jgi:uncharacterized protein YaaW (UPF0174 family)